MGRAYLFPRAPLIRWKRSILENTARVDIIQTQILRVHLERLPTSVRHHLAALLLRLQRRHVVQGLAAGFESQVARHGIFRVRRCTDVTCLVAGCRVVCGVMDGNLRETGGDLKCRGVWEYSLFGGDSGGGGGGGGKSKDTRRLGFGE